MHKWWRKYLNDLIIFALFWHELWRHRAMPLSSLSRYQIWAWWLIGYIGTRLLSRAALMWKQNNPVKELCHTYRKRMDLWNIVSSPPRSLQRRIVCSLGHHLVLPLHLALVSALIWSCIYGTKSIVVQYFDLESFGPKIWCCVQRGRSIGLHDSEKHQQKYIWV